MWSGNLPVLLNLLSLRPNRPGRRERRSACERRYTRNGAGTDMFPHAGCDERHVARGGCLHKPFGLGAQPARFR